MKRKPTLIVVGSLCVGLCASVAVAASTGHRSIAGASARSTEQPAVPDFAALARARSTSDVLPAQISSSIAAMNASNPGVTDSLYEGQELANRSRLLISNVGTSGATIYAYPTSKGRVCFINTIAGGGCVTHTDPFAWGETPTDDGKTVMVYGIAPNSVRSVSVIAGGMSVAATLQRNAFYFEQSVSRPAPSAIIATFENGSTQRFGLPDPTTTAQFPTP